MAPENEERKVDRALAENLATGYVSAAVVLEALEGFGEKRAVGVLDWAHGTGEAEKALLAWGKKRGASHDWERRREDARRRGRRLALEDNLRTAFRKQVAAEYLISRRKAALEGGSYDEEVRAIVDGGSSMWDGERIRYETAALKASCAGEYPPETLEARLGFDPTDERELERRVRSGEEPSPDDRRRVEVYKLAAEALVEEFREQVAFLEERLREVLPELGTGYHSTVLSDIREIKGLPHEPLEYDR